MVTKTAWQAVVAKLGPLPPACKTLNNDELNFLLDSLERTRRAREHDLDSELSHWLESLPLLWRRSLRRLLGR